MNKKLVLNIFTLIMLMMIPMTALSAPAKTNKNDKKAEVSTDKNHKKAQNGEKSDTPYHEPDGYDKVAHRAMIALAIGIVMGLATLGGTIGQGFVGASAINGIAKNPGAKSSMQTMLILIMVLIESIVIYALVVAILLFTKL